MAWKAPSIRQLKSVFSHWARLANIRDNRTNKRIAQWSYLYSLCKNKRNSWFCYTIDILNNCDLAHYCDINIPFNKNMLIVKAESVLQSRYLLDWN